MEAPQLWKKSIQNLPDKKEIIIEMIAQIKKDFAMFSENIEFNENAQEKYANLFSQLEAYLKKHFSKNTERLYPILYRIDILEKDIQYAINQQSDYNFIALPLELIHEK